MYIIIFGSYCSTVLFLEFVYVFSKRYTLKNSHGVTIQILNLGGIVTSILVPDKQGKFNDVTTGFDTLPGD